MRRGVNVPSDVVKLRGTHGPVPNRVTLGMEQVRDRLDTNIKSSKLPISSDRDIQSILRLITRTKYFYPLV